MKILLAINRIAATVCMVCMAAMVVIVVVSTLGVAAWKLCLGVAEIAQQWRAALVAIGIMAGSLGVMFWMMKYSGFQAWADRGFRRAKP